MRGGRGTGRGGPMARGVAAGRGRAEPGRVSFGLCGTGAMGGGGSAARRVTFEADENDHVTVVKGVRLSETVINRMKETSSPGARPSSRQRSASGDHDLRGATAVNEEELKKRIAEELALEQARRETEAHKRLKQDQMYVRDELGKVLERERTASNEHLTRAILRERAATEEERVKAERFAKQLEEKDRELKKHDAYYKEQLARLEERVRHLIWGFYLPRRLSRSINLKSAQFYKVTTEQYQKAANEVEARFKRYESHPICADLQGKILQCYQQNSHETLSCSALANQYLHCVNHAKQSADENWN
uniref:Coiled-coil-helix-coiled-coil-helix domain containing 3 n=1 Tax=Crocodylus porosus TaxID=8502 RepID=A0A7M4E0D3_CROPO